MDSDSREQEGTVNGKPAPARSLTRAILRRRVFWGAALLLTVLGWLGLDGWLYHNVASHLKTPDPADRDFYTVTLPFWEAVRFFPHVVGIAISYFAVVAFHQRGWRHANAALAAVLVAALIANVAQKAIGRARPDHGESEWTFVQPFSGMTGSAPTAFPSGEAATAFALALVLARCFPRLRVAFYTIAVLVAAARFVNGMHYLSDVLAGGMLGLLLARVTYSLILRTWRPKNDSSSTDRTSLPA